MRGRKLGCDRCRRGVFCPRDPDRPSIEGRLELDDDTLLARATWRFRTPEPVEEAGGEVFFAGPERPDFDLQLFPSTGRFWRKLVFEYYEEWMEYREWLTCARNPNPRFCP